MTTSAQTRPERRSALPPSLPPRGLSRVQAAEYIGVSPSLFDEMVRDGRMHGRGACDVKGGMAAMLVAPAPRASPSSTVSAWSS